MRKKHANRFSIVFNENDERQLYTMNYLNGLSYRSVANFVAQAVYAYTNGAKSAPTREGTPIINTPGKRRRGRPRKNPPPDTGVYSGGNSSGKTFNSLSHTQHSGSPVQTSVMQMADVTETERFEAESKQGSSPVDNEMLDSMMKYVDGR